MGEASELSRSQNLEAHRLHVGDRTHRIVAAALEGYGSNGAEPDALDVATFGRRVFEAFPIAYRPREALLDSVTAACVYLHRLRPPTPWQFIGSERPSGACRFDLVWEHAALGVLVDELKLGIGRAGEAAVRSQIDRQVAEATSVWPKFVGVRLCAVHEPAASRLFLPGRRRSVMVSESSLAGELAPR